MRAEMTICLRQMGKATGMVSPGRWLIWGRLIKTLLFG